MGRQKPGTSPPICLKVQYLEVTSDGAMLKDPCLHVQIAMPPTSKESKEVDTIIQWDQKSE